MSIYLKVVLSSFDGGVWFMFWSIVGGGLFIKRFEVNVVRK